MTKAIKKATVQAPKSKFQELNDLLSALTFAEQSEFINAASEKLITDLAAKSNSLRDERAELDAILFSFASKQARSEELIKACFDNLNNAYVVKK